MALVTDQLVRVQAPAICHAATVGVLVKDPYLFLLQGERIVSEPVLPFSACVLVIWQRKLGLTLVPVLQRLK